MTFPLLNVLETGKNRPILLHKGRAMPIVTPTSLVERLNPCTICGVEMMLDTSETLVNFEKTYLSQNHKLIEEVMESILESYQAKKDERTAMEQELTILKRRGEYQIVRFIVDEVYKYLSLVAQGEKEEILEKTKACRKMSFKRIEEKDSIIEEYYTSTPFDRILNKEYSLLERVALNSGEPILIIDGHCYTLTRTPERRSPDVAQGDIFSMEGVEYLLKYAGDIDQMNERFVSALKKLIEDETLRDKDRILNLDDLIRARQEMKDLLSEGRHKRKHPNGDIGFFKHDGQYYVFLEMPNDYALEGFDGRRYFFEKCTIAVQLRVSENRVTGWESPIVVGRYKHPFINADNADGDFRKRRICVSGDTWKWKEEIEDDCKLVDSGEVKTGHQVYEALRRGRKVLLTGYMGKRGSFTPHNHLDKIVDGKEYFKEEREAYLKNPITPTNSVVREDKK